MTEFSRAFKFFKFDASANSTEYMITLSLYGMRRRFRDTYILL